MTMKTIRRLFALSLLALGAAACGTSDLVAPECSDPAQCEYIPDAGGMDGYIPDAGGMSGYIPDAGG